MAISVEAGSCALQLRCRQISSTCTVQKNSPETVCFARTGSNVVRSNAQREWLRNPALVSGEAAKRGHVKVKATIATDDAPRKADLSKLKAELLAAVAGLDRGLVAEDADEFEANAAALNLEAAGDALELPEDLDKLQGRWRLIFSSGFSSGSYGGQRPGPSIARSPFYLGSVYQRIDVPSRELDNIVDLRFPAPWPLPPLEVTATLAHSFELAGGAKIRIIFEKTLVKPTGFMSQLPQFELPQLPEFIRPRTDANGVGSGEFETTYLDQNLRISRGDRGELRIFVKA